MHQGGSWIYMDGQDPRKAFELQLQLQRKNRPNWRRGRGRGLQQYVTEGHLLFALGVTIGMKCFITNHATRLRARRMCACMYRHVCVHYACLRGLEVEDEIEVGLSDRRSSLRLHSPSHVGILPSMPRYSTTATITTTLHLDRTITVIHLSLIHI